MIRTLLLFGVLSLFVGFVVSSSSFQDLDVMREMKELLDSSEQQLNNNNNNSNNVNNNNPTELLPKKPEQFRNARELHDYLDGLKQVYTVLGRPRYGRRGRR